MALVLWALALPHGTFILLILALGMVWFVNLYNFMDGIDGYAAVQCLLYCAGALWLADANGGWALGLLWVLSGATLGFLAFNLPPAKIFMGDVGSGFLGLAIAVAAVQLAANSALPLVASLILLSGFWFDATVTLCVRLLTGQKFMQARRSHLYQRWCDRYGHGRTTVLLGGFGLVWLLPLAAMSVWVPQWQYAMLALAIVPLAWGCWRARVGWPSPDNSVTK